MAGTSPAMTNDGLCLGFRRVDSANLVYCTTIAVLCMPSRRTMQNSTAAALGKRTQP